MQNQVYIILFQFRSIKMRPGGCDGQKRTDSMEDRISDLNAQFTFMIYESISRSLFQVCFIIEVNFRCSFTSFLLIADHCMYFLLIFSGPRSYIFFYTLRWSAARKGRNPRRSLELFPFFARFDWRSSECRC